MGDLMQRLNAFAETTVGKVVLGVVAVAVLGVALFMVYRVVSPPVSQPAAPTAQPQQPPVEQAAGTTTTAETTQETLISTGFETFSSDILRDPFEPLESEEPTAAATTETTVATPQPLGMLGVHYQDGELVAEVTYENQARSMKVGETVGPYLLVKVDADRATFLYNDVPVTLQVGETYSP